MIDCPQGVERADGRMQATATIAVFIHVATIGRYQAVLEEVLQALNDTGTAGESAWIEVGVVGAGAVGVPDIGVPVHVKRLSDDVLAFEHPTLSALRDYCLAHGDARVLYLNCLGGRHVGYEWQIRVEWRKLLRYLLMTQRRRCLAALRECDVCAVQWVDAPMPHASSNNWWANARYVASLPELSEAVYRTAAADLSACGDRWTDPEIKRRHSGEFWLGMQPAIRPFSLLDLGRTRLPKSSWGATAWWEIPGVDWERVARRQLGDRRFDRSDVSIFLLAVRLRAAIKMGSLRRRLFGRRALATGGHRH